MATAYSDCGAALGAGEAPFRYQNAYASPLTPYTGPIDWRPRWAIVLKIGASTSRDEIKRAYHALAVLNHPDHGGSDDAMAAINKAYDEALAQLPKDKVS